MGLFLGYERIQAVLVDTIEDDKLSCIEDIYKLCENRHAILPENRNIWNIEKTISSIPFPYDDTLLSVQNIYSVCENRYATIPVDKSLENLPQTINSIPFEYEQTNELISGIYSTCEQKYATLPNEQTLENVSTTIESIPMGVVPKGVAVDGVKWDEEWEAKGQNGTIVDIVVGDEISKCMIVSINLANKASADPTTIDWGDGTQTVANKTTSEVRYSHTYENPGHYVVTVDNKTKVLNFGFASTPTTNLNTSQNIGSLNCRYAVRRVRQYGCGLQNIQYMFSNCVYLNSEEGGYPGELPPFPPTVTSIMYCYYRCLLYKGHIPYLNHLSACTNTRYAFAYLNKAFGSMQILPPKTSDSRYMYSGCMYLDPCPYDIFPDSLSSTLADAGNTFEQASVLAPAEEVQFPKISHLVKCASFANTFVSSRKFKGDLPELPAGNALTSVAGMFNGCIGDLRVEASYMDKCTNLKLTNSMFINCSGMTGECPRIPKTVTNCSQMFQGCLMLGGSFPEIPPGSTSLYNIFYNCYNISGELPDIPADVIDLRSAFCNCYGATGRLPDLGNVKKLTAGGYVVNLFNGCKNVTLPPERFFTVQAMSNQTTVASLFSGCNKLKSFEFDLWDYANLTACNDMFRYCYELEHGPNRLPQNATSFSNVFAECYNLQDNIIHYVDYPKLTNIGSMYNMAFRLKIMVDENGDIILDKSMFLNSNIKSYSNAFISTNPDVQRQVYDALVALGKTGTEMGSPKNIPYEYCNEYKGGMK